MFFIRIELDLKDFGTPASELEKQFGSLGDEINASWEIKYSSYKHRIAIFVSKLDHCLQEILWRHSSGELNADIVLIISNHNDLKYLAERYEIPFHYLPVTKEN